MLQARREVSKLLTLATASAAAISAFPSFLFAQIQPPSAAAKSELAPTGKLRVAFPLNFLTAPKNAAGQLEG